MPSPAHITFEAAQDLVTCDGALRDAVDRVAKLDFTMVCMKLVKEGGWTSEVCEQAEDLYRKFLALNIRYPDKKLSPTGPVDEFWHAHILDTRKYADDCHLLFGGVLHHYPYFGMRDAEDRAALEQAFDDTVDLFIRHFGVDPSVGDSQARGCSPQKCP